MGLRSLAGLVAALHAIYGAWGQDFTPIDLVRGMPAIGNVTNQSVVQYRYTVNARTSEPS